MVQKVFVNVSCQVENPKLLKPCLAEGWKKQPYLAKCSQCTNNLFALPLDTSVGSLPLIVKQVIEWQQTPQKGLIARINFCAWYRPTAPWANTEQHKEIPFFSSCQHGTKETATATALLHRQNHSLKPRQLWIRHGDLFQTLFGNGFSILAEWAAKSKSHI